MASSTSKSDDEDTETDNFYSPANFAFYEASPYKPLTLVPYHIRLLKVTRDAEKNTFGYELTNGIPLREVAGDYTAISYCAGDPKNTLRITVDGKPFNAFANLVQAIEETCRYLPNDGDSTHEKVLIWADQICINQSDHHERAAQVGFMYEIFQSAREVAVCLTTYDYALSLADGKIDQALECIIKVYREVPGLIKTLRLIQEKHPRPNDNLLFKAQANKALGVYLQTRIEDKEFALGWWDVVQMQKMPWFTRTWVIQEYAANSKAVFLFANQSIPDRDFAAVMLSYTWNTSVLYSVEGKLANIHDIDRLSTDTSKPRTTTEEPFMSELSIRSSAQRVRNALRAKSYFSKDRPALVDLLDYSRNADASDPRDHVYSCLGLARRSYGIRPYYGSHFPVEDLFASVMRIILLSNGGDINLIERASTESATHDDALPSWVPDWRESVQTDTVESFPRRHADSAGGHTPSSIKFDENGKVLITKGVRLDVLVLETGSHEWKGEREKKIRTLPVMSWSRVEYVTSCLPEKGDEVWVLHGARCPMLLRKKEAGYIFLRTVDVHRADGEDVKWGNWMNNAVDLEKATKSLRII